MLERFAAANGLQRGLEGIHVVEQSGVALMQQSDGGAAEILGALQAAIGPGTAALVIGGAALGGIAQQVAPRVPVAVIDSVQAGARAVNQALRASGLRNDRAVAASSKAEATVAWGGLSDELLAALTRGVDPSAIAHPTRPRGG
jgi:Asp/Glu/hydantoin racemase